MGEKLHAMICPHPRHFHFRTCGTGIISLKINPIRVDAIIDTVVWLNPVSVHITWVGLLCAKAPIDEDVLNAVTATANPFEANGGAG